jgi:hypothetical protein
MAIKKYFLHICKLKHTVNKVSSLRDLVADVMARVRKLKHTVNKVSSLRDLAADGMVRP